MPTGQKCTSVPMCKHTRCRGPRLVIVLRLAFYRSPLPHPFTPIHPLFSLSQSSSFTIESLSFRAVLLLHTDILCFVITNFRIFSSYISDSKRIKDLFSPPGYSSVGKLVSKVENNLCKPQSCLNKGNIYDDISTQSQSSWIDL